MGQYYLFESADWEVLMFRFLDLAHLANNLFMEQGRLNLMSKLREYGPFANIFPAYVRGIVAHLVIVPKICLKPPCEEYSAMEVSILKIHFGNLPKVHPTSHQTFCSVLYKCRQQHYCWFVVNCQVDFKSYTNWCFYN